MSGFAALILAAGKGTRMRSEQPKVLHEICGRPMVEHVVRCAEAAGAGAIQVVIGHGGEAVATHVTAISNKVSYVVQEQQLGTGHAVMVAKEALADHTGPVLILSGDVPLVTPELVDELVITHRAGGGGVTLVSIELTDPGGYGRVVRDTHGRVSGIVEQKDASHAELAIHEVNAGMYLVDAPVLFSVLSRISSDNAQGEYYLTDIVAEALADGTPVHVYLAADAEQLTGVNSRAQLAAAGRIMRARINLAIMDGGVTLIDPATTYIDAGVQVGPDSTLHPGVTLQGDTTLGAGCRVMPNVRVADSRIGDNVEIRDGSLITEATLAGDNSVGPMAHLRPGTVLKTGAKVGNYVEIKKAIIGEGSKVNHLSYVGDAHVGNGVNIGAGTITCNYDGANKFQTVIDDNVFIGSDSQLVAPVHVGKGALIAAGSTITGDIPPGALGISRSEQRNVPGWVERWKRRRDPHKKGSE